MPEQITPSVATSDTGLTCLVMLARFHQIAVDPEQLAHQFRVSGEPFGKTEILLAAKHLGLQAKPVKTTLDRLDRTPLPAMAVDSDGSYFILARFDADKALIQDPKAERPQVVSRDELLARWSGELILFTSRASLIGEMAKFDFSWFIPAVVKYRKLLGEVLLVSFVLQSLRPGHPVVLPGGDGQGAGASGVDHAGRHRRRPAGGVDLRSDALGPAQLRLRPHHQPHRRGTGRAPVPPSAASATGLLPGAPRGRFGRPCPGTGEHPRLPHRQCDHRGAGRAVLGGVHRRDAVLQRLADAGGVGFPAAVFRDCPAGHAAAARAAAREVQPRRREPGLSGRDRVRHRHPQEHGGGTADAAPLGRPAGGLRVRRLQIRDARRPWRTKAPIWSASW